jgi:hypothetical protein
MTGRNFSSVRGRSVDGIQNFRDMCSRVVWRKLCEGAAACLKGTQKIVLKKEVCPEMRSPFLSSFAPFRRLHTHGPWLLLSSPLTMRRFRLKTFSTRKHHR